MPMDWNQDPYLQRLEEELKKMNERLSMIEQKMAQPQKLLTVKEVAQFLCVKERTVRSVSYTHLTLPTKRIV